MEAKISKRLHAILEDPSTRKKFADILSGRSHSSVVSREYRVDISPSDASAEGAEPPRELPTARKPR